ncbi:MAG: ABC transporter permease [Gemmatimonadetes bacterium]|nr:ABC transporter permease [Gemmatimonadota bacterium]
MRPVAARVADALVLLWLVATLTFVLLHLAPGDPVLLLAGPTASAAELADRRAALGLDAPLPAQYATWLAGVARGDLGVSVARAVPVTRVIAEALPVSLGLGGASLALSLLLGTLLGTAQALRLSPRGDRWTAAACTVAQAIPGFWLALALVALFTSGMAAMGAPAWVRLPAFGMRDPAQMGDGAGIADLLRHAVLPVLTLAIPGVAGMARYARQAVREGRGAPHVRTARAHGLPPAVVDWRHILLPSATSLVVVAGLLLPGVIAGSVFVEQVFAWPGMGRAMLAAIAARDYPVVQGMALVYAAAVVGSTLLADAVLVLLDPRRRAT